MAKGKSNTEVPDYFVLKPGSSNHRPGFVFELVVDLPVDDEFFEYINDLVQQVVTGSNFKFRMAEGFSKNGKKFVMQVLDYEDW